MLPTAQYSKDAGFTLIEFLVAVLIMMAGLMALLQSVNVAIVTNGSNKKRAEAVVLADQAMGLERIKPFSAITTAVINPSKRSYAGLGVVDYAISEKVNKLATNTKNVQITVSWQEKGVTKTHSLTSVLSQPPAN